MRPCSKSSVLQFMDAIAIAIAQGYLLARARLTSHPSPVVRLAVARDAMAWDAALLDRELAVFRHERERIPSKQRPHYTPTNRLKILLIMRLRDSSAAEAARRFVLHPQHGPWLDEASADTRCIECPFYRPGVEPYPRRGPLVGS